MDFFWKIRIFGGAAFQDFCFFLKSKVAQRLLEKAPWEGSSRGLLGKAPREGSLERLLEKAPWKGSSRGFLGKAPRESLGFLRFRAKNRSPIPAKSAKNSLKTKGFLASRNSVPDPPDPAETQHPVRNRPWVPRAGGQDDGSLHKLPQITEIHLYCRPVSAQSVLLKAKTTVGLLQRSQYY